MYIGDEYNFIYKLDFNTSTVTHEWNLNDIVGDVNADKGIESLAFDGTYFYAGIQGTSVVHQVHTIIIITFLLIPLHQMDVPM